MSSVSNYANKNPIRHWLYLILGALIVGLAAGVLYWMVRSPYTGIYHLPGSHRGLNVVAVAPGSPAELAGLQPRDQILKLGDRDVSDLINGVRALWLLKPHHSYQIIYKRGDFVLTRTLIPKPSVFPYSTLIGFIFSVIFLGIGLFVYLKKASEPSARIFYLIMLCECASSVVFNNFQAFWNPAGLVLVFFMNLMNPLMLHFALIFPKQKNIVKKHPSIQILIYIPIVLWFSARIFLFSKSIMIHFFGEIDPAFFQYFMALAKSHLGLYLVYQGSGLACLAHTFFKTDSPETRRQLQWIFYGWTISFPLMVFSNYILFQDMDLFLSGSRPAPLTSFLSSFVLMLAFLLAIFKYRLMDIDRVIYRSLAYFLISGITALLYIILFGFFSWVFELLIGKNTFIIFIISALLVAFIFRPMFIRIEQWIDQVFYRRKYALYNAMEKLTQALITVRNPKEIFQKVFQAITDSIHIHSGLLLLSTQNGNVLQHICMLPETSTIPNISIEPSHPLVRYFLNNPKGLTHYQITSESRFHQDQEVFLDVFQNTNTEIILPLIYKDNLIGMIGLGKKLSGDIYSSNDVGMLTTLAYQTAVAMQNAQAYSQAEHLNLVLEEKVTQTEQQQKEILALQKRLFNENVYLKEEIKQTFDFEEIIGESNPMKKILAMVKKIAPTLSTVLLRGESGTGKELIARAIHYNSPRRDEPFIKVNCSAIPTNLLESELFGHEKGAFTGAVKSKTGKFELAAGGSIFLDEIGDLELNLQSKLLRVLQEKQFERVGGNETLNIDVRIIAATNRNIEKAISNQTFREDLFYRLNVISLTLPTLRERKEDIRELTVYFLNKFSRQMGKPIQNIDPEAMETLKLYDWPGNVRELANVIERSVVLGEGNILKIVDLPKSLTHSADKIVSKGPAGSFPQAVENLEKELINEALEEAHGNKSKAARQLGLKRTTFNNKLKKYEMG